MPFHYTPSVLGYLQLFATCGDGDTQGTAGWPKKVRIITGIIIKRGDYISNGKLLGMIWGPNWSAEL